MIISSFLTGKGDMCVLQIPWKVQSLWQSAFFLSILDIGPEYFNKVLTIIHLTLHMAILIHIKCIHFDLEIPIDMSIYLCSHTYTENP